MKSSNIKKICSYVRREGRMTAAQKAALSLYDAKYCLSVVDGIMRPEIIFGRNTNCILEIGFGMGASLLQQAQSNPEDNFIGIEVHRPGIGALLLEIEKCQLTNIRIYSEDAVEVLKNCIAEQSLAKVQIFFPDPWPKQRHHKRRLIQDDFISLVVNKLFTGGQLHLATDWADYAQQMMCVLNANYQLTNLAGLNQYLVNPNLRPTTKFEQRGLRLQHQVFDLLFQKTANGS